MRRALAVAAGLLLLCSNARAYDPALTHAGLTERAVLASQLQKALVERYDAVLGLYEPLRLALPDGDRLVDALGRLDGAQGYRPSFDGRVARLPAIEWVVAGSVVEEVPPERARNHFYDPVTRRGLDQGGFLEGSDVRVADALRGTGSLRGLVTGSNLDGTGRASPAWLVARDNDLGLWRFVDAVARAALAPKPADRESALAEALLVAGALVAVVEDAGEPAFVRDDFRVELVAAGAPYERFVADRYGRLGVPAPAGPARPVAHLSDLISDAKGDGLADLTARRFPSLGTLPSARTATGRTRPPELHAGPEPDGYATGEGVKHLARWHRDAETGSVTWTLDERCEADAAEVLLPATAQAALDALAHLFRGALTVDEHGVRTPVALGAGRVSVAAEDDKGMRRVVAVKDIVSVEAGASLGELPAVGDARRVVAVFQGVDAAGEPLVAVGTLAR